MIILHFQTGSDWHTLGNQSADSWNLLRDLVRYPNSNTIICTVAQRLTPMHLDKIPALDEVMALCIKQKTFIKLTNLGKFQRRELVGQLLAHISGFNIQVQDVPDELATFVSYRAAGNPKLVMDVLHSLWTGYKSNQVGTV